MNFYDLDLIKSTADCRTIATAMLGLKVENSRCAATWRGGDNETSVRLTKEVFCDHGDGHKGGSVVDLVAKVKGIDFYKAVDELGKYLNIEKSKHLPDAPKKKIACEDVYTDVKGIPRHKTIRYEPKDFDQQHWDGSEWKWGLNGVEMVPFNLPAIVNEPYVIINEGEKAAKACIGLGLPGTCFALGAGSWKPEYTQWFKCKKIIVVADNDDAGIDGANRIVFELRNVITAARIVKVSDKPKGDFYEFVEDGGTVKTFQALVKKSPAIDLKKLEEPQSIMIDGAIEKAKKLNKSAFCNYIKKTYTTPSGDEKEYIEGRGVDELIQELYLRLLGFPRVLSGELFDCDLKTHKLSLMINIDSLFAWISQKTKHVPEFKSGSRCLSKGEFFQALLQNGIQYDSVSSTAEYPTRTSVFYAHPELPPPSTGHNVFNGLLEHFCPHCSSDTALLKCLFMSAVYQQPGVNRPLWIIDSEGSHDKKQSGTGRGIGKTSVAEILALLVGSDEIGQGETMNIERDMLRNENTVNIVLKRFLSGSGRQKKIALLDNISTFFTSDVFAQWATSTSFSGLAPFGHGETTRQNNITFIITCNSGSFSYDILRRSMIIYLDKPKPAQKAGWDVRVRKYVRSHRHQIIADIIDLLKSEIPPDECWTNPESTYATWENEVLRKACEFKIMHESVIDENKKRIGKSNGESDEGEELEDIISEFISRSGYNPDTNFYWIKATVMKAWIYQGIRGFGGREGRKYKEKINSMIKVGALKHIATPFDVYPHRYDEILGKPVRGFLWQPDDEKYEKGKSKIKAIIEKVI